MVEARFSFGYWKTANPGPHVAPKLLAALALKKLYHVPSEAKPLGMLLAAGRYQASAYPSDSSPTPIAPWTWVTIGTGPWYGPGVLVKVGRVSRLDGPPGGLAQCSV